VAHQAVGAGGLHRPHRPDILRRHLGDQLGGLRLPVHPAGPEAVEEVDEIARAVVKVQTDADQVVSAFHNMASVTEENTAATEEMTAATTQVTRAVDDIAKVATTNSERTRNLADVIAQLTHSTEGVSASARHLSEIAQNLQGQVERFKL
jgi:methyl-accepting chemotaxis protein